MKEFIEKLIGMLEDAGNQRLEDAFGSREEMEALAYRQGIRKAIEIANQLAEEYNNDFCEWNCGGQPKTLVAKWESSCGDTRIMQKTDSYKFCPCCGKKIKVIEKEGE